MDFPTLEIFRLTAESASVTKAARSLGRAPSNVTSRIQGLEAELGVALFSREGKKMTLTPEGAIFLTYARRLLDLELEARFALSSARTGGLLRVGSMESAAASRLPAVLTRFGAARPETTVRLKLAATRELAQAVAAGDLDCALVARLPESLGGLAEVEGLAQEPVWTEDLLIALPGAHPEIRTAADLRMGDLAALEPGCAYRRIAEDWARRGGSLRTAEVSSYHAILASVVAGEAAGVMPRSVFELLTWPAPIRTHSLGPVETLLIHRPEDRSAALLGFREALRGGSAGPL